MFALAIRYLNGWAMAAADGAKKEQAEWPPHPERVFMALAAAWFETGEDSAEEEALRWLEAERPPAIAASDAELRVSSDRSRVATSYVPVNDARVGHKMPADDDLGKLKSAGLAVLPEYRSRQPRRFPVAVPHDPVVHLIWSNAAPPEYRAALDRLASKVTRIGHSASLVQAWIADEAPRPDWQSAHGATALRLRVPSAGRLNHLARQYNREVVIAHADMTGQMAACTGKEKKRMKAAIAERFGDKPPRSLRPLPSRWEGYDRVRDQSDSTVAGGIFDSNLLVMRLAGKRLPLSVTLKLTEALRGALMAVCPQTPTEPIPEWLSGHTAKGQPSVQPHVALLPLPHVGSEHADGRILGVAVALPTALPADEVSRCLGSFLHQENTGLPRTTSLFSGKWFECSIEMETRTKPPAALNTWLWTRSSRIWASVTPVALDRHFDGKDRWSRAAESVKKACERIDLPQPREVMLQPVSLLEGAPHAREFPPLIRKSDGGRRYHSHVVLIFDEPVRGPVLIGAGRFRGYGLCRPMDRWEKGNE